MAADDVSPEPLDRQLRQMRRSGYRVIECDDEQVMVQNRDGVVLYLRLNPRGRVTVIPGGIHPLMPAVGDTSEQCNGWALPAHIAQWPQRIDRDRLPRWPLLLLGLTILCFLFVVWAIAYF
jgi:hypothetical protein